MSTLIIRRIDDGSEVHRVDVSGKTPHEIERIMRGLLRKLRDDMYIDDSEVAQEIRASAPPLAPAEGVEMSLREQAAETIAKALCEQPTADAYPLAYQVMRESGARRALWASLSIDGRKALVRRAEVLAESSPPAE